MMKTRIGNRQFLYAAIFCASTGLTVSVQAVQPSCALNHQDPVTFLAPESPQLNGTPLPIDQKEKSSSNTNAEKQRRMYIGGHMISSVFSIAGAVDRLGANTLGLLTRGIDKLNSTTVEQRALNRATNYDGSYHLSNKEPANHEVLAQQVEVLLTVVNQLALKEQLLLEEINTHQQYVETENRTTLLPLNEQSSEIVNGQCSLLRKSVTM